MKKSEYYQIVGVLVCAGRKELAKKVAVSSRPKHPTGDKIGRGGGAMNAPDSGGEGGSATATLKYKFCGHKTNPTDLKDPLEYKDGKLRKGFCPRCRDKKRGINQQLDDKYGITFAKVSKRKDPLVDPKLKSFLIKNKKAILKFFDDGELPDKLYEYLFNYYSDNGEMPYGTQKARTGDPYQWLGDKLEDVMKQYKITGSNKGIVIRVNGTDYDIEIMDSTHIKFRIKGTQNWATPLHFNQLSDEMMKALKSKGVIKGNFFTV